MINLTLLAIASAVILGVARLNKSNKLFWTLFMSMLIGFTAGSIGKKLSSPKQPKKEMIKQNCDSTVMSVYGDSIINTQTDQLETSESIPQYVDTETDIAVADLRRNYNTEDILYSVPFLDTG